MSLKMDNTNYSVDGGYFALLNKPYPPYRASNKLIIALFLNNLHEE